MVVIILSVANIASADTFGTGDNQFTIDFVNISGDTNPTVQQTNGRGLEGYGIVNNNYRMGTYEITNDQWNKFSASLGVPVTGSPSDAYEVSPTWTGTNVPTNMVSWYEAAQFVNWLNTSTGHQAAYNFTGTLGTTDYTFTVWESGNDGYDSSNPYRNSNAYYFLPTQAEWVKTAYWNGTSIHTYATKDDTFPGKWSPAGGPNSDGQAAGWNYDYAYPSDSYIDDQPWDVTAGYSPEELNGTFDMMGNVWEWLEGPHDSEGYLPGSDNGLRGGSYIDLDYTLRSYFQIGVYPDGEFGNIGFRVASVPEPTNHSPVADAGDAREVYACIDGTAEVALNGSDSNDIDSDELSYYWSWMIDDEIYDANGVAPTIELSVGEHIIELIVNDGIEDSEPNEVVVTVIDSIELLIILTDYILELDLHSGIENSLLAKIDTAFAKLEDDNDKNDKAAATSLQAFINAVEAQSGKKISQDNVDYLIETAQQAIDILCTE